MAGPLTGLVNSEATLIWFSRCDGNFLVDILKKINRFISDRWIPSVDVDTNLIKNVIVL
jgi:hypothetical protein